MSKNSRSEITDVTLRDCTDAYGNLILFSPNRYHAVHRWFELVEGYSTELVRRIIGEQERLPERCLDPFGGVGTTAVTCQSLGIECHSFENNPFFYQVARTKLRTDYDPRVFKELLGQFKHVLGSAEDDLPLPDLETTTLFEVEGIDKWIFNRPVASSILNILHEISRLEHDFPAYASLFKVALAAILIPVSNVYRNGKALSYRKNWDQTHISSESVYQIFLDYCAQVLLVDLKTTSPPFELVHNYVNCKHGDARQLITELQDDSIDLCITSPPYLNSRDYTDVYRVELWMLGHVSSFKEERAIRTSAIRSHVQVRWEYSDCPEIAELADFLDHLDGDKGPRWNPALSNMVRGYFCDIEFLMQSLASKMKQGGKVYINVANSAYGGCICPVDIIIARIAENAGLIPHEIRIARYRKSSIQQNLSERLRESIIVLERE